MGQMVLQRREKTCWLIEGAGQDSHPMAANVPEDSIRPKSDALDLKIVKWYFSPFFFMERLT